MNDLECPYCEASLEVNHDDGFGFEEDQAHEMECSECGKNFVFWTSYSLHYEPAEADCLNGSPHPFRGWVRLWEDRGQALEQRRCVDCGHREQRKVPVTPVDTLQRNAD